MKIGLTGTKTYENRSKIKNFLFGLKKYDADITIISLGERDGADRYIKKFALEFGYDYKEANLPHSPKNLFSLMTEAHYDKPYSPKNYFLRNKIYVKYIDKCVVFDDSNLKDTKISALMTALSVAKKLTVIVN